MENKKGEITKLDKRADHFIIYFDNEHDFKKDSFTCFLKSREELDEGMTIQAEFMTRPAKQDDRQFRNILKYTILQNPLIPKEEVVKDFDDADDYERKKQDDIHWQVCLKIASEQVKGTPKELVKYSKELFKEAWK